MSFECARCHEYKAGVGTDPPQFCGECDGMPAACATCAREFEWPNPTCACESVHGEWTRPLPG